jgi:mannosyltransferase
MSRHPAAPSSNYLSAKQWILFFLFLLAFGRGIWALGGKSLWWDESLSLHRAKSSLSANLSNQIVLTDNVNSVATTDNHPPFYFLLLWLAVRLFGQSEFALRFISFAAAVLIVPLLYATGKRLVDDWAGLAAAALGALSPMYLWYAQEARMYTLLALLSLLSFYCFVRAFLHRSGSLNIRRHWPWIATFVLASLAALVTHYLGVLLIAFELLALGLIALRQTERRRAIILVMIVTALASLPLLIYAGLVLPYAGFQPGFHFIPLADLLRDLLNSFSLGLSVDSDYWYVLLIDLVFLFFMLAGLVWLVRPGAPGHRRTAGWLLVGYLSIPVVAIFLMSYVQPAYMNSRHLILITPAFYLLVGSGLTGWRGRAQLLALLGGLIMIAGVSYSTWNYFNEPAFDKDNHREWGAYLRKHVRPGDIVVVEPPHIAELYEYYADSGVPWIGLPQLGASREDTIATLEDLSSRYDRVWLALSRTPPWGDRGRVPVRWLDSNTYRVDYQVFHSYASTVSVAAYLADWPAVNRLPADAQRVEVRYRPSLRLLGYRLASQPQPGKLLHVELFWAVDEPITEEANVVLRLVDKEGHLWGEGDQCPLNGQYPMGGWPPGQTVRDEHELYIQPGTPPDSYELELVLVSLPTEEGCAGARGAPISPILAPANRNRGDRVLLGTIQAERPVAAITSQDLDIERSHRARFSGLALVGSDLAATELKAGERLAVLLYWQARQAPLPDAVFRLRLTDTQGKVQQEKTIRPVGDAYPSNLWQEGDTFKGQFWLRLPDDAPAGRYRLEIVPEPPLTQDGPWAAIQRALSPENGGVRLGYIQVQSSPQGQASARATPVPEPSESPASRTLIATLGDQVRFLGYDMQAGPARVGENLSFTLYWQAMKPMDVSYTVFTHLLGPSDQVIGQKDSVPQDGAYPTTLWQPGDIVADSYTFTIDPNAPPGEYPIEIGMYRVETATRLPVTGADGQPLPHDRILLPDITVLPKPTPSPVDRISAEYSFFFPLAGVGGSK